MRPSLNIQVEECDTMDFVKAIIESLTRIPTDQQRLFFRGYELAGSTKASETNIFNGSNLILVDQAGWPFGLGL